MRIPAISLCHMTLAGALFGLFGCGSRPSSEPAPARTFDVNASYGTLSFRGTIDRVDRGNEFEYRTHIDITFHPGRTVNLVPAANLIACRFVASVPSGGGGPWQILHEETRPISISLSHDGQTAHLPDVRFRLSKIIAAQAREVGVAVLDGRFMWPIPVHLQ